MQLHPFIRKSFGLLLLFTVNLTAAETDLRPNILWLTSEDHGPHMGCYGDTYADTPNVDRLASSGLRYTHAWSTYPVCAPARTTLISGLYPMGTGSEHMRSKVPYPAGLQMYPQLMQRAGYYCINHYKQDFNMETPGTVWDDTSSTSHWKNCPPGTPFFAIFNAFDSHESQIRNLEKPLKHDPDKAPIPAYHPDTEVVRLDWARYYDTVTSADAKAGERLDEIAEAGLIDDTIVFYYADHGSGMPRNKRFAANLGLHVPLVVYIPEKFKHLRPPEYMEGGTSDRLVGFIDMAPTLLSLAGVKPPEWMEGHAFLGEYQSEPQEFLFGGRARMDERYYDLVRCVTDGHYVYIRNYMPHRPHGQHLNYQWETATTREWERFHLEGKLTPEQDSFWQPRQSEELYDLKNDPDEVHNLANSPQYAEIKAKLRSAQQAQARKIRDLGFLPEGQLFTRAPGVAPYDFKSDPEIYPFAKIFETAELASMLDPDALPELITALKNNDSAVRYWGAMGLLMRGETGISAGKNALVQALDDDSPQVAIVAAEALITFDGSHDAKALDRLIELADPVTHSPLVSLAALNSIDAIGEKARPLVPQIVVLSKKTVPEWPPYDRYPFREMEWLLKKLLPDETTRVSPDREYWIDMANRLATPVLSALAEGRLKQTMPVETAPDGETGARAKYTHLEALGRLLCGIAPWLELGDDGSAEGILRAHLAQLSRQAIHSATDPASPDLMNFSDGAQPLVDAAFLAQAFIRAPNELWEKLDLQVRKNVVTALRETRNVQPYNCNWILFAAEIEAFFHRIGEEVDPDRLYTPLKQYQEWYLGDGIYGDGPEFHWDYYNSFVIQPMLYDIAETVGEESEELSRIRANVRERLSRFATIQERLIAPDGSYPATGRSITYRSGAFQALAVSAWQGLLPEGLKPAQARQGLSAVIHRTLDGAENWDSEGWLRLGLSGHQPHLAEGYISTGSLYLCSAALLPLGLPSDHPFWSDGSAQGTWEIAWTGTDLKADHALHSH